MLRAAKGSKTSNFRVRVIAAEQDGLEMIWGGSVSRVGCETKPWTILLRSHKAGTIGFIAS